MAGEARAGFASELARLRAQKGRSLADVAVAAHVHRTYLSHVEHGRRWPSRSVTEALDGALDADGALIALWADGPSATGPVGSGVVGYDGAGLAELHALAEHAERSDVTPTVLDTIDAAVDGLARDYARARPEQLLRDVRALARQIGTLLDGRSTLAQRRRLMVAGGWLALLSATLHIDLGQRRSAVAARTVAASLDRETEHGEIGAWAVEIDTWAALVDQDWRLAAALASAGRDIAPTGSGAAVQLAAQHARAAARLGDGHTVRAALDRAARMIDQQPPERPRDHHFAFDARKLDGYCATALAWIGDRAGEREARSVVDVYSSGGPPRRLATARLDLGLILARDRRPDEAAQLGGLAVDSGTLVPSNVWRATELDDALDRFRTVAEAAELHERRRHDGYLPPPPR